MKLKLQNTLTGKKEIFEPLKNGEVSMYHCGPTVYDYAHIGNMRSYVFADLIRRWFEHAGSDGKDTPLKVLQVINITDVGHLTSDGDSGDDKVENAAKKEHLSVAEITGKYIQAFHEDLRALNIETEGTIFPKASEHIKEQVGMIIRLKELGYTYEINDGIYFDTSKFPEYGKLGNIDIKGLKEGARVEMAAGKRHATDFALWKFSPENGGRLQEWNPSDFGGDWGVGFPGWHIECSAMSIKYLGENFDIHTGGIDHIPVHHNNEIAQAESFLQSTPDHEHASPWVNYWLHNAFITIDGNKFSKSLGNSILIKDIIARDINPLAYRYFLLSAHYSTTTNFTWDALLGAKKALNSLAEIVVNNKTADSDKYADSEKVSEWFIKFEDKFADDLNTPQAIGVIWTAIKNASLSASEKAMLIKKADALLGLGIESIKIESNKIELNSLPDKVLEIIEERRLAREAKDWKKSDELRDLLAQRGFEIKDGKDGVEVFGK